MIKAVYFDFDGTLAHFRGDFELLMEGLRTELDFTQCDLQAFASELSSSLRHDGAVTLQSALEETLSRLELRIPTDLPEIAARAAHEYATQVHALPGALELLAELSERVPLALITNGPEDMQQAAIERTGVGGFFKMILISGAPHVAMRKPARGLFEKACRQLGVQPAHVLMIGDNLQQDIMGARDAGLQVIHVGQESQEDLTVVTDLQAVRGWLSEHDVLA